MHRTLFVIVVLLVSACTGPIARGPEFSPSPSPAEGESLIYVYKPFSGDGITLCLKFLLNNQPYGCLEGEGFLEARVSPGKYNLVLQTDTFMGPKIIDYNFTAEEQEIYYFKFVSSGGPAPDSAVDKSVYGGAMVSGGVTVAGSGVHWLAREEPAQATRTLSGLRQSKSSL